MVIRQETLESAKAVSYTTATFPRVNMKSKIGIRVVHSMLLHDATAKQETLSGGM